MENKTNKLKESQDFDNNRLEFTNNFKDIITE
jgi:hypothetical protein